VQSSLKPRILWIYVHGNNNFGVYRYCSSIVRLSQVLVAKILILYRAITAVMSGKKRPGYQAGSNLVELDDPTLWERVEGHNEEVIDSIPHLQDCEKALGLFQSQQRRYFTKKELEQIIQWKHTVGKSRPANKKLMEQNSDAEVQEHTRSAIAIAVKIKLDESVNSDGSLTAGGKKDIQAAIACMDKLKGIGPAGASAVLSLIRPDIFCYFFDEAIDCFEAKREYRVPTYLRVNSRCLQIAKKLGGGWTTNRVAKTIWIASRFLAIHGDDLSSNKRSDVMATQDDEENDIHDGEHGDEEGKKQAALEVKAPQSKRLRTVKK
jgi:hypothetical protein